MNNKLVMSNHHLMHKKQSNQDYLEELYRKRKQNEANVAAGADRGARILSSNRATEERFAREEQAAQARSTVRSSGPSKGHVSTSNSGATGDQYTRAASAAAADRERTARRKADQERINAANRQASEGSHGKSSNVDWSDPNSASYKAWKKAYNTEYYKNNSEYWERRYKLAHPMSGAGRATAGTQYEGASRAGRSAEVKSGAEAMRKKVAQRAGEQAVYDYARGQASRGMHGRTTQAQAAQAQAARDTSVSTKYGLGAKAKDLGREIVSSGKNYVSNYADGARQIKDLWSSGAQSIANSGKNFLDKLINRV